MHDAALYELITMKATPDGECLIGSGKDRTQFGYKKFKRRKNSPYTCKHLGMHPAKHIETTVLHVALWITVNGPIPDGFCVCHTCDNPPCVRIEHLFLGTDEDNRNDKLTKGRQARGQAMGSTQLLSEDDVRKIRADTRPSRIVASEYGVNQSTISRIRARKRWDWLE